MHVQSAMAVCQSEHRPHYMRDFGALLASVAKIPLGKRQPLGDSKVRAENCKVIWQKMWMQGEGEALAPFL